MRPAPLPTLLVAQARRRQRRLAALAVLLWMVGVELAPGAHLLWHDRLADHHHHGADDADVADAADAAAAPRVIVHTGSGHSHAGRWHEHGSPTARVVAPGDGASVTSPDGPGRRRGSLAHGAGSLAHHQLALATPPPAVIAPLPVARHATTLPVAAARSLVAAAVPVAGARGPPT